MHLPLHTPARAILRLGLWWGLLASAVTQGAPTNHYVFAHYMVCFATYSAPLVDGYKQEIQQAQGAGIDGFALDVGVWNDVYSYYKERVAAMYDAAEQLGTGFKLFFFVEFPQPTDIINLVTNYAGRSASFRYQGKLVLSAWGMNNALGTSIVVDWTNAVLGPLRAQGCPVFFIPHFWPDSRREMATYDDANQVLARNGGFVDGLFLFGAAGVPWQLGQCNSNYTKALHESAKLSMASMTPHYWGWIQYGSGRRYFETGGGEGIALQWSSILTNQPDWVDLVTWNDFNESTYICPVDDPGQYFSQLVSPVRFSHKGYLELSKYYIAWFKTGQPPALERDALFYFYRTHPLAAVASSTNEPPVTVFYGDAQDAIYATTFLVQPAQLEVASGANAFTNQLPRGIQHSRIPFAPGPQMFKVRRGDTVVLSAQGPDIQSRIGVYDFFPASGYAYGPSLPGPPGRLRTSGP